MSNEVAKVFGIEVPIPFHGRLLLSRSMILYVNNSLTHLSKSPIPSEIVVNIEIDGYHRRPELHELIGEVVKCYPNEDMSIWAVEKYEPK